MNLKNTKTLQSLINAFAGESEARNRYTFYSKIAQKEGFQEIAEVFIETANNEMEHAKLFYKEIPNNTELSVNEIYPIYLGDTKDNLKAAFSGEKKEWEVLYKNASIKAKEEGFDKIAQLFQNIANIEHRHAERFQKLHELLDKNLLFNKENERLWICRKCGHTQYSKNAPIKCPVCEHPQGYFQIYSENF